MDKIQAAAELLADMAGASGHDDPYAFYVAAEGVLMRARKYKHNRHMRVVQHSAEQARVLTRAGRIVEQRCLERGVQPHPFARHLIAAAVKVDDVWGGPDIYDA